MKGLDEQFKNRLKECARIIFPKASVYVAGSRSILSVKQPTDKSDLDIFVFMKGTKPFCALDEEYSKLLSQLLNFRIEVFVCTKVFEEIINYDMEIIQL